MAEEGPSGSTAAPLEGAVVTLFVQLSGNAAVIKPSEVSFHSAKVMEELLPLYLDKVHPFLYFFFFLSFGTFEEFLMPVVLRRIYIQW